MMDIQKAIIKYKGRSDYERFYGDVDGTRYFFMENGTLSNGNMIGSTELVEVIEPTATASSLGVLSPEGNVVIPFENKLIKPINDRLLLVELSKPVSKSVSESLASRSDPLAATRLVNTAATIKEKMNEKLGAEGRFVFNDQFSEASIFTNDGQNVMNDQYYSYIGMNADSIYLSKNTVDSPIDEYGINAPFMKDDIFATAPRVEPEQALDLKQVVVDKQDIDTAIENTAHEDNTEEVLEETSLEEKKEEPSQEKSKVVAFPPIENKHDLNKLPTVQPVKIVENNISDFPSVSEDELETRKKDIFKDEEDTEFSISEESLEKAEHTLFAHDEVQRKADIQKMQKNSTLGSEVSDYYTSEGSIFQDATSAFAELITQNKELKSKNTELKEKNEVLETRLSASRAKFIRYEKAVGNLEARVQSQDAVIADQEEELIQLRRQLQGKQDFVKLLDEARGLLGSDVGYSESRGYGKKAA